jgi:hypothetical protein
LIEALKRAGQRPASGAIEEQKAADETLSSCSRNASPAPTIGMMLAIQKYILDSKPSDVMAMIAAAFQYETYAACRTKQAQNMRLEGYDGEFCYGVEARRKTPRGNAAPMRHIACIREVMDDDASFLRYAGLFKGLFGKSALRTLTTGPRGKAVTALIHAVLMRFWFQNQWPATGSIMRSRSCCKKPVASHPRKRKFTRHSPRLFLVKCAMARGELEEVRRELGRWCGSTLASKAMTPASRKRSREAMQLSRVPEIYTHDEHMQRVAELMLRQVKACRALIESCPQGSTPREYSFDRLPKCTSQVAPFVG